MCTSVILRGVLGLQNEQRISTIIGAQGRIRKCKKHGSRERKQLREIKIERSEGFLKNIFAVIFNIMINYVVLLH